MTRKLSIVVILVVAAALGWFYLRPTAPEMTKTDEAAPSTAQPAEKTMSEAAQTAKETVKEATQTVKEATTAAAESVKETAATATETVKEDAKATVDSVKQATTTTVDAAKEAPMAPADLLTPENFDIDKVNALLDASTLSDDKRAAFKATLAQAQDNPAMLASVLGQIKTAMGL